MTRWEKMMWRSATPEARRAEGRFYLWIYGSLFAAHYVWWVLL